MGLLKIYIFILFHHKDGCLFLYVIHFRVKEEVFWKNYFYRVSLIKQSAQLTALAAQQAAEWREVEKTGTNPEAVHQKGKTIVPVFSLNVVSEKNKEFQFVTSHTQNQGWRKYSDLLVK